MNSDSNGEIQVVENTPFDFQKPCCCDCEKLGGNEQFDDAFKKPDIARRNTKLVSDSAKQHQLEMGSDGVIIFNVNPDCIGKDADWLAAHPDNGLAVELQTVPDAIPPRRIL
ncbi:hypothetical protein RYX41_18455 [Lactiplantibacillus plantarum]|nr:hypothetical protein [Lactiplantibacillus plantarum]